MDLDEKNETKPVKIYSSNREERKLIGVTSYADLVTKCLEKFNYQGELKFVLNEDGMEVDEESWGFVTPLTSLMVLHNQEVWSPCQDTCIQTADPSMPVTANQVFGLIENLKQRPKRKMEQLSGPQKCKKSVPNVVKISPGWKNFSYSTNSYTQIRSSKCHPIPTGDVMMKATATYDEVISQLKDLYFPQGKSFKGRLDAYLCELGNSKSDIIGREGFTPVKFIEDSITQKARLYLLTKKKIPDIFCLTDEDSDDSLPNLSQPLFDGPRSSEAVYQQSGHNNLPSTSARSSNEGFANSSSRSPFQSLYSLQETQQTTPQRESFIMHADTPTVTLALPDSLKKCVICCDRSSDAIIWPCVHAICYVCGIHLMTNNNPCPMYRGPIEQVKVVHFN